MALFRVPKNRHCVTPFELHNDLMKQMIVMVVHLYILHLTTQ